MSLQEQKKRFIQMNGDPLGARFTDAVLNRPVLKAAGLAAVFNIVAFSATPLMTLTTLAASAIGYAVLTSTTEVVDLFHFNLIMDGKTSCIDTKPDQSTPPTSQNNLSKANTMRTVYGLISIPALATSSFAIVASSVAYPYIREIPIELTSLLSSASTAIIGLTAHCISAAQRFNRVSRRDWVIVELPKQPQKQEDSVTTILPQPIQG